MEAITREEQFMAAAAGQAVKLPEPITRREKFLKAIAERGGGAQTGKIYQFEGYSEGVENYVLEKGSYMEYMDMVSTDPFIRAEVLDLSGNFPRVFPFAISLNEDGGEALTFQNVYFDFSKEKIVCEVIVITSYGAFYECPTESGGGPG